jgi:hypothetical protein
MKPSHKINLEPHRKNGLSIHTHRDPSSKVYQFSLKRSGRTIAYHPKGYQRIQKLTQTLHNLLTSLNFPKPNLQPITSFFTSKPKSPTL